jgi:NTE family protein
MKIILVLGAGGPVGQAFHAGVLRALADGGWDPCQADLIVGTSAGAHAGALLRAGLCAEDLFARAVGEPLSAEWARIAHLLPPFSWPTAMGYRWPASLEYLSLALRQPRLLRLGSLIAALLPEGRHDDPRIGHAFARLFRGQWPSSSLWIPAVHLDRGERVVFGHPEAPLVDVGTAVRCSSAVPGLRCPVTLSGDRFVDGGIASATHVDLLAGLTSGAVIVSSPLSRFAPLRRALQKELACVQLPAALFEPDEEVMAAMGWNPMRRASAPAVARAAYRCAARRLESLGWLRALFDAPLSASA